MTGLFDNESSTEPFCGASIIRPKIILTAAHCFMNKTMEEINTMRVSFTFFHFLSLFRVQGLPPFLSLMSVLISILKLSENYINALVVQKIH